MEVLVTKTEGLPEGAVLSIRAGTTRRQAPLPLKEPMRFPSLPLNAKSFKIDVLTTLCSSRLDIEGKGDPESYSVALGLADGSQGKVDFNVREEPSYCGKRAAELKQADFNKGTVLATTSTKDPAKQGELGGATSLNHSAVRNQISVATREYLERHNLHSFVQEMLQYVLRERPEMPYLFMVAYLTQRAAKTSPLGRRTCDGSWTEVSNPGKSVHTIFGGTIFWHEGDVTTLQSEGDELSCSTILKGMTLNVVLDPAGSTLRWDSGAVWIRHEDNAALSQKLLAMEAQLKQAGIRRLEAEKRALLLEKQLQQLGGTPHTAAEPAPVTRGALSDDDDPEADADIAAAKNAAAVKMQCRQRQRRASAEVASRRAANIVTEEARQARQKEADEERVAVVKLQCATRRRQSLVEVDKKRQAKREFQDRAAAEEARQLEEAAQMDAAAIKVQSVCRGRASRHQSRRFQEEPREQQADQGQLRGRELRAKTSQNRDTRGHGRAPAASDVDSHFYQTNLFSLSLETGGADNDGAAPTRDDRKHTARVPPPATPRSPPKAHARKMLPGAAATTGSKKEALEGDQASKEEEKGDEEKAREKVQGMLERGLTTGSLADALAKARETFDAQQKAPASSSACGVDGAIGQLTTSALKGTAVSSDVETSKLEEEHLKLKDELERLRLELHTLSS